MNKFYLFLLLIILIKPNNLLYSHIEKKSCHQPQEGPPGPTGATGANGPIGQTGNRGPTGPTGVTGMFGATGSTGPTGANGNDGLSAADGPAGATGPNGSTGNNGATGPTGSTGANGPSLPLIFTAGSMRQGVIGNPPASIFFAPLTNYIVAWNVSPSTPPQQHNTTIAFKMPSTYNGASISVVIEFATTTAFTATAGTKVNFKLSYQNLAPGAVSSDPSTTTATSGDIIVANATATTMRYYATTIIPLFSPLPSANDLIFFGITRIAPTSGIEFNSSISIIGITVNL